jgi:apolipoprotein N-acyltransferase
VRKDFAWLTCISIVLVGYGSLRLAQHHRESSYDRTLKIAIVQPNISVSGEANHPVPVLEQLLNQSRDVISKHLSIDLITWPEVPVRMTCDVGSETNLKLNEFATQHNVALLINCTQISRDGRDYNTELFVSPDGTNATYHKQILFPFTEFIPGEKLFPELRKLFPGVSRYAAGTEATVFPIGKANVFAAVCYEILFPNHARKFVQASGDVLVSPANDAWFGRNRIPDFEVAAAVFQAVQHRIPVVRVSNSGNSVAVYSSGELVHNSRTQNFITTTSAFQLTTPPQRSLYSNVGDVFLYLLVLGLSVSVVVETRRKRSLRAVRTFKVDRQSTPSSL